LPEQVTVTVAPNGTFLTRKVVNLVVVFFAVEKNASAMTICSGLDVRAG
jgi:hypothetical protein